MIVSTWNSIPFVKVKDIGGNFKSVKVDTMEELDGLSIIAVSKFKNMLLLDLENLMEAKTGETETVFFLNIRSLRLHYDQLYVLVDSLKKKPFSYRFMRNMVDRK